MQFRLLGPIEVVDDQGRTLSVVQSRVRGLLWLLLLWANRPVTPEELSEALWVRPPAGFQGAMRTHVWALRRQLGSTDRLGKDTVGYRLAVWPGERDLDDFRLQASAGMHALYAGDARAAEAGLVKALSLWRDPYLADLPDTAAAAVLGRRLLEERRLAAEQLVDARVALGHYREVLGELREKVAAEPLNERAWQQLMLSLYCCGRRAEALEAYRWAYDVLANGHGIDPGPGLRRLHERILADDPSLTSNVLAG